MGIAGDSRGVGGSGRALTAQVKEAPGPEFLAEVTVSTATAILFSKEDPYLVLVGKSAFSERQVLPGGKQETTEEVHGATPGLSTIIREVEEETGVKVSVLRHIGTAIDKGRDIRIVPAAKLRGAVISEDISSLNDNDTVKAHYGCPDEIYVGEIDTASIRDTEELTNHKFLDIRSLQPGDLSRGHDVILLCYRLMLDQKLDRLPEAALRDFASEVQTLI